MAWTSGGASRTGTSTHKRFRTAVLRRDRYRCTQCGHTDPTGRTLIADHILNVRRGGTDHPDNGRTLCRPCHEPKTQAEAAQGRALKARQRPTQRHPGLL
ncbi:HNH endonuclease [Rhodococcus rhodochrous]|uniref:HNH endonuclease n=1 Tax=Rhodococcus rhodochrous TaxID=1829 RepID=UPI00355641BA